MIELSLVLIMGSSPRALTLSILPGVGQAAGVMFALQDPEWVPDALTQGEATQMWGLTATSVPPPLPHNWPPGLHENLVPL